MKVGDRVRYRSEPCYVVGFYNNRRGGWVLIERADGSRGFVKPAELHSLEEKERQR